MLAGTKILYLILNLLVFSFISILLCNGYISILYQTWDKLQVLPANIANFNKGFPIKCKGRNRLPKNGLCLLLICLFCDINPH